MKIALISCSQKKLSRPAPARELYCSPLFRLSLAYAEQHCERAYVLSAKHGLVDLDQVIEPYDDVLTSRSKAERRLWGARVALSLRARHSTGQLVMLAGEPYVLAVRWNYPSVDQGRFVDPLRGLQIGQRLSALHRLILEGRSEVQA